MEARGWCGEAGGFVPGDPHPPHWLSSTVLAPLRLPSTNQGIALAPTPSRAAPEPPLPRKRGRGREAGIAAPTFPLTHASGERTCGCDGSVLSRVAMQPPSSPLMDVGERCPA